MECFTEQSRGRSGSLQKADGKIRKFEGRSFLGFLTAIRRAIGEIVE
ncbi:MAG: hypothetical protein ACFFD4_18310 [Candidatus Odinarchaeota archaeon]